MVRAQVDLTNSNKAQAFLHWARINDVDYTVPASGYIVEVEFRNILEVLQWV